jgi:predicted ATPase
MDSWVLSIKNSWLLQDSEIEIAPFTIIAGFNATGKSMIARTIYALAAMDLEELSRLWSSQAVSESCEVSLDIPEVGKLT